MQNSDTISKPVLKQPHYCWLAVVLLIVLASFLAFYFSYDKKQNMIDTTLEWGRLASFPVAIDMVDISTEGSSFSREFVGSFTAPETAIRDWISRSPGLLDAQTENISEHKTKFIITPGGGAGYAELVIDFEDGLVEFNVYWS